MGNQSSDLPQKGMEADSGNQRAALVDKYIKTLQRAYADLRKLLIDKTTHFSPADDFCWKPVAEILIDNSGDPHAYVRFVFDELVTYKGDIFTNMITSVPRVQDFLSKREERIQTLERRIALQVEAIRCRIKNGWSLDDIFNDGSICLSPVVRFALAWSEKREDLAMNWRDRAREQIRYEPAYRELLRAWLPEAM